MTAPNNYTGWKYTGWKIIQHTGWYCPTAENSYRTESFNVAADSDVTLLNLAGYIPIVGAYICYGRVCRIRLGVLDYSTRGLKITMFARGIIEALGLGLLFLIPDLIVTLARPCIQYPYGKTTILSDPYSEPKFE